MKGREVGEVALFGDGCGGDDDVMIMLDATRGLQEPTVDAHALQATGKQDTIGQKPEVLLPRSTWRRSLEGVLVDMPSSTI